MTLNYYLKNILIGIFCAGAITYFCQDISDDIKRLLMLLHALVSSLLFPFAKLTVETIALKFTTKEFWHKGFFKETARKSGLYAIFWVFCFYFSIPLSIIFLLVVKKLAR